MAYHGYIPFMHQFLNNFKNPKILEIGVSDGITTFSLGGDREAAEDYVKWITDSMNNLPAIRHHSWLNIERKIKTYRIYWQSHWESLYSMKQEDTAENNMFFDKKWSEVTDEEISNLANRLSSETGGHVFHKKIDWTKHTPYLSILE